MESLTFPSLGNFFFGLELYRFGLVLLACGVLKTKKCKRCIGFEGN